MPSGYKPLIPDRTGADSPPPDSLAFSLSLNKLYAKFGLMPNWFFRLLSALRSIPFDDGEDRILNPELRFPDEFVRHKMLDLTGDLSLLGRPLCAHVVAYRAGHDLHARLARRIWKSPDCWYLAPWAGSTTGRAAAAEE